MWEVPREEAENAVGQALEAGCRLIDTAKVYGNELSVEKAQATSNVPSEDLFIITNEAYH